MKSWFTFLFIIMTLNLVGQNIKKHRWKNRVLLIHANNKNSDKLQQQIKILSQDKNGLRERKLKVYQFSENQFTTDFNTVWFSSTINTKKYKINSEDFIVILIGLDGGVKYQQTKIVSLEKLFVIIDGMPMRRNELKN